MEIVCPKCNLIIDVSPCPKCGTDLNAYFKPILITSKRIDNIVQKEEFFSKLSLEQKCFIKTVLLTLDMSYKNKLLFDSTINYFGVKSITDSSYIRFFFAIKLGRLSFKYRKSPTNIRNEVIIDKYDKTMLEKIVQLAVISMTYQFTYRHLQTLLVGKKTCHQQSTKSFVRKTKKLQSLSTINKIIYVISKYEKLMKCQIIYDKDELINAFTRNKTKTIDNFYKLPGITSNISFVPKKYIAWCLEN